MADSKFTPPAEDFPTTGAYNWAYGTTARPNGYCTGNEESPFGYPAGEPIATDDADAGRTSLTINGEKVYGTNNVAICFHVDTKVDEQTGVRTCERCGLTLCAKCGQPVVAAGPAGVHTICPGTIPPYSW